MHEQSATLQRLADWYNTYGAGPKKGQTLPPQFLFERNVYPGRDEAVFAARMRSLLTDPQTEQPRTIGWLELLKMIAPPGPQ